MDKRLLWNRVLLSASLMLASAPYVGHCDDGEFFEKKIRPLLVKRCYACHSGAKTRGGLSLETRGGWSRGGESGPAIVPGKPEDSLLIAAVRYESLEMPPADQGGKLPDDEIAALTKWVAMGAPDPRKDSPMLGGMKAEDARQWWAFQPLPSPDPDPSPATIDEFINASLAANQVAPSDAADKRTLLRRATYDLTGLPPTAEEMAAFLADDSPDAFLRVIDRLIASPNYGPRWGRHWLDIVRYADTAGENTDRPLPHAWRYRNWVIESMQRDLPFDDFIRLQIAGDVIRRGAEPAKAAEGIIATGYLAIARRFGHDIDKDVHLMHEDVIDNLGKGFLGLTLGCARCHDHKYDPVTMEDYYALYGVFSSTKFAFPGCEPKGQPRDLVPLIGDTDFQTRMAAYEQERRRFEELQQAPRKLAEELKSIAENSTQLLAEAAVPEGKTVPISDSDGRPLTAAKLKKGEALQLVVRPNASHGADTTRVQLRIRRLGESSKTWDVANVIPKLIESGPFVESDGATWCFLEITNGPVFLRDRKQSISGVEGLNAWSIGDTPSVVVNAATTPAKVWTELPPNAFFVHPGPQNRPVGLVWICPEDGQYSVEGSVGDAHPINGGDGVAFRLEHLRSTDFGSGLIRLAQHSLGNREEPAKPNVPVAYAVVEATPMNSRLHKRGDPEQPGDEVARRWLSVFGGAAAPFQNGSGRQELAERIAKHPLAARVMANRIWQWHFGRGLVATPSDFGSRGERPSHPELLDWLAAQFRANGYRIKPMHRLIMQTAAYRRSSNPEPELVESDPNNRYLARFSRRRLTAEEFRDSLLHVSGQLDLDPAQAHPFPEASTWKFTQHNPFNAVYPSTKRSVYLMVQRQRRHPFLALFDGADPNSSTSTRQTTTVPTQALYFLNDEFFHAQAAKVAERVLGSTDEGTLDSRLQSAFRLLFQRLPTDEEHSLAKRFFAQYPGEPMEQWRAYSRVLLASNEFLHLD